MEIARRNMTRAEKMRTIFDLYEDEKENAKGRQGRTGGADSGKAADHIAGRMKVSTTCVKQNLAILRGGNSAILLDYIEDGSSLTVASLNIKTSDRERNDGFMPQAITIVDRYMADQGIEYVSPIFEATVINIVEEAMPPYDEYWSWRVRMEFLDPDSREPEFTTNDGRYTRVFIIAAYNETYLEDIVEICKAYTRKTYPEATLFIKEISAMQEEVLVQSFDDPE